MKWQDDLARSQISNLQQKMDTLRLDNAALRHRNSDLAIELENMKCKQELVYKKLELLLTLHSTKIEKLIEAVVLLEKHLGVTYVPEKEETTTTPAHYEKVKKGSK